MNSAVQALADRDVDSMVTSSALADGTLQAAATVGNQVFDVSKDQIVDYLIENERETTLVESLDDQQANALLIALANGTQY
jgi:Cys-tRNA synthase (O-phospho-L-seryl-tRNA:Cys-tRNA synthase)